jgi:hypothetical protein
MVEAPGYFFVENDIIFVIAWVKSNLKTLFYRLNYAESNAVNYIVASLA